MNTSNYSVSVDKKTLHDLAFNYFKNGITRPHSSLVSLLEENSTLSKDGSIRFKCQFVELFNNKTKIVGEATFALPVNVVIMIIIAENLKLKEEDLKDKFTINKFEVNYFGSFIDKQAETVIYLEYTIQNKLITAE